MNENELERRYKDFINSKVIIEYLSNTEQKFKYTGKVLDIINGQMFIIDKYNQPVSLKLDKIQTCAVVKGGSNGSRDIL